MSGGILDVLTILFQADTAGLERGLAQADDSARRTAAQVDAVGGAAGMAATRAAQAATGITAGLAGTAQAAQGANAKMAAMAAHVTGLVRLGDAARTAGDGVATLSRGSGDVAGAIGIIDVLRRSLDRAADSAGSVAPLLAVLGADARAAAADVRPLAADTDALTATMVGLARAPAADVTARLGLDGTRVRSFAADLAALATRIPPLSALWSDRPSSRAHDVAPLSQPMPPEPPRPTAAPLPAATMPTAPLATVPATLTAVDAAVRQSGAALEQWGQTGMAAGERLAAAATAAADGWRGLGDGVAHEAAAMTAPLPAAVQELAALGAQVAAVWDGITAGVKNAVATVVDAVATVSAAIAAARRALGGLGEQIRTRLDASLDVFGGAPAMAGADHIAAADAAPVNAMSAAAVTNSHSNTRNSQVNIGRISVETRATDADGISQTIGDSLQGQLQQANDHFDNGISH